MDQFVLNKGGLPNLEEKNIIEKKYYKIKKQGIEKINQRLKRISNNLNLIYLNFEDIACDVFMKKCEILTKNNSKIYVDANAHLSFEGAKYLAKKIKEKEWLKFE